jgi:hypothetical protein
LYGNNAFISKRFTIHSMLFMKIACRRDKKKPACYDRIAGKSGGLRRMAVPALRGEFFSTFRT